MSIYLSYYSPRCGKTLSAISIIMHYRDELPALVMLPSSLARQWKAELLLHASELVGSQDICLISKATDVGRIYCLVHCACSFVHMCTIIDTDILLTYLYSVTSTVKGKIALVPYSLIDKMSDSGHIRPDQFGIVIADEVHNLKNPEAKRTGICLPFLKHAKVAVGMSGTPILNRPKEIFTVLSALLPRIFINYNDFVVRYCDAKKVSYGKGINDTGASNTAELNTVLEGIVMVRRLKEAVVASLPTKKREIKYITPDPKYVHQLRTIQSEMHDLKKKLESSIGIDESITAKLRSQQQQQILRYKQVTGMSKVFGVCNIVRDLIRRLKVKGLSQTNLASEVMDSSEQIQPPDEEATAAVPVLTSDVTNFGHLEDDILMVDNDTGVDNFVGDSINVETGENPPTPSRRTVEFVADSDDAAICDSEDEGIQPAGGSLRQLSRLKRNTRTNVAPSPSGKRMDSSTDKKGGRVLRSATKKARTQPVAGLQYYDSASQSDGDDLFFLEPSAAARDQGSKSRLDEYHPDDSSSSDGGLMFGGGGEDSSDVDDREYSTRKTTSSSKEWKKILGGKDIAPSKKRKANSARGRESKTAGTVKDSPVQARKNKLPEKFIIFAYHRDVMDLLEECLREEEVDYVRLDGSSSNSTRNATITDFQHRDAADIALLSLKACGTGLNLTAASSALFAELDWSPATIFQAEDRIHRIGQKSTVVSIIYAIAENSADDIVWEQLQKKHSIVDATVGASGKGSRISVACHNREGTTGQMTLNFASQGTSSQSYGVFDSTLLTQEKKQAVDLSSEVKNLSPPSPVRRQSQSKGSNVISKYLTAPRPASEVYGKPSIATLPTSNNSGVKPIFPDVISLVDKQFSEIPTDLIEQQFRLADELAANRKLELSTAHCSVTSASQGMGVKIKDVQLGDIPADIHIESSQFDYPASQVSDSGAHRPSHVYASTNNIDIVKKSVLEMPVAEATRSTTKPMMGWSLAPSSSVYDKNRLSAAVPAQTISAVTSPAVNSPVQGNLSLKSGNLAPPSSVYGKSRTGTDLATSETTTARSGRTTAPVQGNLPAKDEILDPPSTVYDHGRADMMTATRQSNSVYIDVSAQKTCGTSNMNPPVQSSGNICKAVAAKVLDEATRRRIEENKRKAQLLLQQRKNSARSGAGSISTQTPMPTPATKPTEIRPVAKVSPTEQFQSNVYGVKPSAGPLPYAFSTGVGRAVPVSEAALNNVQNMDVFANTDSLSSKPSLNLFPQHENMGAPAKSLLEVERINPSILHVPSASTSTMTMTPSATNIVTKKMHRSID